VRVAGRIHDIGKIGTRESVLNKPGPLTEEETAHVKEHVRIGVEILAPLVHIGAALTFVQDHHERFDGTGYPRKLSGQQISIGGRILAAADAFDALTSVRAYRQPKTARDTVEYLATQVGTHLDPAVFAALRKVVLEREEPVLTLVEGF
jgi:putative two-component system response regulator